VNTIQDAAMFLGTQFGEYPAPSLMQDFDSAEKR
jgi:hypothetical protein